MNPLAALVASLTGNAATDGSGAGKAGGTESGLFAQLLNANTETGQSLTTLLSGVAEGDLIGLAQPPAELATLPGLPVLAGSEVPGLIDAGDNSALLGVADPELAAASLTGELPSGDDVALPTVDITSVLTEAGDAPEGEIETILPGAGVPAQETATLPTPIDLLAAQTVAIAGESVPAQETATLPTPIDLLAAQTVAIAGESVPVVNGSGPQPAVVPGAANPQPVSPQAAASAPVAPSASVSPGTPGVSPGTPVSPSAPVSPGTPEQGVTPQQPAVSAAPVGPDGKLQQAGDGKRQDSGSSAGPTNNEQASRPGNSSAPAQIVKTTLNPVTGQAMLHVSEHSDGDAKLNAPLETGINNIQLRAATPAQGPAAAPTGPQAPQVPINSLAVHIAQQARNGVNRFEIRLDPPELGRVEIRLDVTREGRVTTHLVVERAETLDLLQRDAKGLERALQDAGLDSPKGNLSFSLKDQGQFHKTSGDDGTPAAQSDEQAESDDDIQEEEMAQRARLYTAAGGLDIRI